MEIKVGSVEVLEAAQVGARLADPLGPSNIIFSQHGPTAKNERTAYNAFLLLDRL